VLTAEIFRPEARLEQEARDGLQEDPTRRLDEMHAHPLRGQDTLGVARLGSVARAAASADPPSRASRGAEALQVELLLDARGDMLTCRGQVTGFFAVRRG
jgi:hypothetical protein